MRERDQGDALIVLGHHPEIVASEAVKNLLHVNIGSITGTGVFIWKGHLSRPLSGRWP